MNSSERDALLVRLDERTEQNLRLTEKQEEHLSKLNEKVVKNALNIDRNHNRLSTLEGGVSVRLSKKQVAGSSAGVVTLLALLVTTIGKMLGWW
ncbi:hypothetical protein LCGC14_0408670 [marine sediment metagenome]|uniref:Uncharacterized protein n=1 Tax=marine sediment metagenome TaxID=412755 RepID=A0A0F9SUG6_9ZZZZ